MMEGRADSGHEMAGEYVGPQEQWLCIRHTGPHTVKELLALYHQGRQSLSFGDVAVGRVFPSLVVDSAISVSI